MREVLNRAVEESDKRSGRLVRCYLAVLEILSAEPDLTVAADRILEEILAATGCEAAALRLRDGRGDYPFFASRGLDQEVLKSENSLCRRSSSGRIEFDSAGRPVLEGLCGAVIRGELDGSQPVVTRLGSFWTPVLPEVIASGPWRVLGSRGLPPLSEFPSAALVPLRRAERTLGLLQLLGRGPDGPDRQAMVFLEEVAGRLACAVECYWLIRDLQNTTRAYEDMQRKGEGLMAMGELASRLAHEIKTPLASVMLSATRLRRLADGGDKMADLASHICKSVANLDETVTPITGSVGRPQLEFEAVDVNEVLEEAVGLIAPRAETQNVGVHWDTRNGIPKVRADVKYLRRAILNLLVNALDTMPDSGVLGVATRTASDSCVEIVVEDTGPGIDPHAVEGLFKPFRTTKRDGTGMGLSIVKRIMELHSGAVTIGPRPERGTEAVLRLPAGGLGED